MTRLLYKMVQIKMVEMTLSLRQNCHKGHYLMRHFGRESNSLCFAFGTANVDEVLCSLGYTLSEIIVQSVGSIATGIFFG